MTDRISKLKTFLESDPDDSFTKFALGLEYQKNGDVKKAKEYFLNIVNADPEYVGVYYHLGKLYDTLDERKMALETYINGIEIAQRLNDLHAASELQQAYDDLQL